MQKLQDAGTICYSIGYNIDMLPTAPTAALTSATNVWSVFYKELFEAAMNGEEIASDWAKGYDDGAVARDRVWSVLCCRYCREGCRG